MYVLLCAWQRNRQIDFEETVVAQVMLYDRGERAKKKRLNADADADVERHFTYKP